MSESPLLKCPICFGGKARTPQQLNIHLKVVHLKRAEERRELLDMAHRGGHE